MFDIVAIPDACASAQKRVTEHERGGPIVCGHDGPGYHAHATVYARAYLDARSPARPLPDGHYVITSLPVLYERLALKRRLNEALPYCRVIDGCRRWKRCHARRATPPSAVMTQTPMSCYREFFHRELTSKLLVAAALSTAQGEWRAPR